MKTSKKTATIRAHKAEPAKTCTSCGLILGIGSQHAPNCPVWADSVRRTCEHATERFCKEIESHRAQVRTFAERLAQSVEVNPMWELDSCDNVFRHAGSIKVMSHIARQLCAGVTLDDIDAELLTDVTQKARSGAHRSTSTSANLAAESELSALADQMDRGFSGLALIRWAMKEVTQYNEARDSQRADLILQMGGGRVACHNSFNPEEC